MMPDVVIEPMRADDLGSVQALLRAASLPVDGLDDHVSTALVARRGANLVGSVALEVYEDGALLRSLAVAKRERGFGWGMALAEAIIDLARRRGVRKVYLLTETAATFFPKLGFRAVTRAEVPSGVRRSVEFTTVCPGSAAVQVLELSTAKKNPGGYRGS